MAQQVAGGAAAPPAASATAARPPAAALPPARRLPPPCAYLTSPAADYLSRHHVAVSLVDSRLRQGALGGSPPPPVRLEQAQAVHAFLLTQQRLRRITSAALVLESTPEAFLLDVQQHLRPLLAMLQDLGLSQEQTTSVFRAMRRQRQQAARFLALGPAELRRRWFWLAKNLGLEGPHAAAYFASAPSLLLAEPAQAAAVVRWLREAPGWRRLAIRRNLQSWPAILLAPVEQLEAAAQHLQSRLDASTDELCLLLQLAPRLLALPPPELAAALDVHPTSWQLAAAWAERPAVLMRHAAEALHLQVATLAVMHRHGWSRQQVADLARDCPTFLRSVRLD